MPDVHVTMNPLAVFLIVAAIGALVVISVAYSFYGARFPASKRPPGPPRQTVKPGPAVNSVPGTSPPPASPPWSTTPPKRD